MIAQEAKLIKYAQKLPNFNKLNNNIVSITDLGSGLNYKKKVETMFQILKDSYSNIKLNLKGKYTSKIKEAKLFACAINYNLSM